MKIKCVLLVKFEGARWVVYRNDCLIQAAMGKVIAKTIFIKPVEYIHYLFEDILLRALFDCGGKQNVEAAKGHLICTLTPFKDQVKLAQLN